MSSFVLLIDAPDTTAKAQQQVQNPVKETSLPLLVCTGIETALDALKKQEVAGARPVLVLLGPNLENPLAVAGQLHREASLAHFAFLTNGANKALAQQLKSPVAIVGSYWSIIDLASENLPVLFQEAANSARQRLQPGSTRNNINTQLSSSPGADISDEKFRLALEAAPSGIIMTDEAGRITLVNSQTERYFGYTSDELIGQQIEILLPTSLRKRHPTLRAAFLQKPESRPMGAGRDLVAVRKDGSEFPVEIGLNPIKTEKGIEVLAVVVDITQRKRLEEERSNLEKQLQQAQKLESLGNLAGGVAHDFNNILTGIIGNADLALLDLSPASSVRAYIENAQKAAIRAADLCKQMLAYSGKGRFLIQALDLNQAIEEISHLLQASISETAIISYNLYPDLPAIEADASQIHQVILNLVTNASEAIGDTSGVITITTALIDCDAQYLAETFLDDGLEQGAYVYLEVADTGCGMDKETQDKIFDPFYTTKFTGRGLGLAAVLGIVRGHKGAIEVNSEPGRGTAFRILFPCSHKEAVKASKEALNIESFQGKGKGLAINKVLVIDDEEGIRMVAQRTLERAGLQVITASDGREGLKVFEETKDELSLVILDLTMPHLNGEEALVEMRQINPDVPVILTSGYNEQEISTRFEGQELAGFIQKPFRPTVLLAMVERVLNRMTNSE